MSVAGLRLLRPKDSFQVVPLLETVPDLKMTVSFDFKQNKK
jgi:hypothetical protein